MKKYILMIEKLDISTESAVFLRADDNNPAVDETMKIMKVGGNPGMSTDAPVALVLARDSAGFQRQSSEPGQNHGPRVFSSLASEYIQAFYVI